MSSKFRVCTELAEAVKKLGYCDEIGFHQFLYPAEKSSRELIAFLLDSLPQALHGERVRQLNETARFELQNAALTIVWAGGR